MRAVLFWCDGIWGYRTKIDPYYLAAFLLSPTGKDLLNRAAFGTVIPSLPVKALAEISIPLEGAEMQRAVSDACRRKINEIRTLRSELDRARAGIAGVFEEAVQG